MAKSNAGKGIWVQKLLSAAAILFFATQIAISQNWVLMNAGINNGVCIASSANGRTIIAGQWPGCLGISTDSGATWTTFASYGPSYWEVMTNGYWASVASSADGTKLLAAAASTGTGQTTGVYLSPDSGANWVRTSLPDYVWSSVAMSADGNIMAAVAGSASIHPFNPLCAVFCSTDSGTTWVPHNIDLIPGTRPPTPISVVMSADGRKIFAVAVPEVCYSTNFGRSWMVMTNAPAVGSAMSDTQVIASSADGNKLVLCVGGSIYTSTNSGATWNLTPAPNDYFDFVASSADGEILMATAGWGGIAGQLFISTNSGASWTSNGIPSEVWAGVACSADGGSLFAVAASDANRDANSGALYASHIQPPSISTTDHKSIQPPLINMALASSNLGLRWLIP